MALPKYSGIAPPPKKKKGRSEYNFEQFKPGESTHVKTEPERRNVLIAFKYWTRFKYEGDKHPYATSSKVDETDVAGPGYRIWFMTEELAAMLAAGSEAAGNGGEEI